MNEFDMKTKDFMAIYRFSGVKLTDFWSKTPIKMKYGRWI